MSRPETKTRSLTFLAIAMGLMMSCPVSYAQTPTGNRILLLGDQNYPPYEFDLDGQPTGLTVDVIDQLSRRSGQTIDINLLDWSESQKQVRAGVADGHSLMSPTEERRKVYDFTDFYLTVEFTLFIRDGTRPDFNLVDLDGRTIAVTDGGLPKRILMGNHPGVHLTETQNDLESISLLLGDKVDAFATSRLTGSYLLDLHGVAGLRPINQNIATRDVAIAILKGNRALVDKLNNGIRTLQKEGTIETIRDRWLGSNAKSKLTRNVIVVFAVVFAVVLLLAVTFLFVLNFRRKRIRF